MDEQFQFDREKFKDLIHLIVDYTVATHGADALGNTKLHKAAYYSDMLHYLDTGHPLTGADYQRQKFGPTARHLSWAVSQLAAERRVTVETVNYYGYPKKDYRSLCPSKPSRLSEDQIRLVRHVCDFICAHSAAEISEFSHDEAWASVSMGERIPYFAAFAMLPAEVTDEDLKDAQREATRLAPEFEAGGRESGNF